AGRGRHLRPREGARAHRRVDPLGHAGGQRSHPETPAGRARRLLRPPDAPASAGGLKNEDTMMDVPTKGKVLGRLRRIEGQVQGIQRMVEEDKYCVDILLQLTAVQGAVEQVQKLLLGQHLETCVADAVRSGSSRDRQKKLDELLEVFSRFSGRKEAAVSPKTSDA